LLRRDKQAQLTLDAASLKAISGTSQRRDPISTAREACGVPNEDRPL